MTIWLQPISIAPDENWEVNRIYNHEAVAVLLEVDYEVLPFDFVMAVEKKSTTNQLDLCYANALTTLQATYLTWAIFKDNKWETVQTEQFEFEQVFRFSFDENVILCGFFHQAIYSDRTLYMIGEFPTWTKMRQEQSSVGHQLINAVALGSEQFRYDLNEVLNNFSLQSFRKNDQPWVMIYDLPDVLTSQFSFVKNDEIIPLYATLHDFYTHLHAGMIVDYANQKAYSRVLHDEIELHVSNEMMTLYGTPHLIWSQLDEWGALFDLKRRALEPNFQFIKRIETYSHRPSSSTNFGLIEAIARETNQIHHATWKDDRLFFVIPHKNVIKSSIQIDHQYINDDHFMDHEMMVLKPKNENKTHHVSWISDFTMHDGASNDPKWVALAKDEFGFPNEWWSGILLTLSNSFRHLWQYGVWNQTYFDLFQDQYHHIELPIVYDQNIDSYRFATG